MRSDPTEPALARLPAFVAHYQTLQANVVLRVPACRQIVPKRATGFVGARLAAWCLSLLFVAGACQSKTGNGAYDEGPVRTAEKGPDRRPSDWAAQQRLFPHGVADPLAYHAALAHVKRMAATEKMSSSGIWRPSGPTNIGGRFVDIEYDPVQPNIVYAAAATGGVFKSVDAGATWKAIFDDVAILTIGDIALDPANPDILYVGTGEANGGHNNLSGGGVFKSRDGGISWTYMGLAETTTIGRILVDPSDSRRVLVAAVGSYFAPNPERGVFLSEDEGHTWQKILHVSDEAGAIDLAFHPVDPQTIYAAFWQRVRTHNTSQLAGPESAVYRSLDGGRLWKRLGAAEGLPDQALQPSSPVGRIGLAVTPAEPDAVWALFSDGRNLNDVYRSSDRGDTWSPLNAGPRLETGTGGFSWFFGQIRVAPDNPSRIFVLDVALMVSSDAGQTWDVRGYGAAGLHVDHHALAWQPGNPGMVLVGHDGGISRSQNGGRTWNRVSGLPVTQFYHIGLDPHRPGAIYGGTQDNGTIRTTSGENDDWAELYGGDGFYVIVDPSNANTIYAEAQFGILVKSTDGGQTFRRIGPDVPEARRNWSTPVVMDPSDSQVLYYGADRIYRSTDAGESWSIFSPVLPGALVQSPRFGTISTIAVASSNPGVVYAGTDDGRVWVTEDMGMTWKDVSEGLPYRSVTRIAVDPTDAARAFVSFSGLKWKDPEPHVLRTASYGAIWERADGGLPDAPVNVVALDPWDPQVVYAGSDVGAFVSRDSGASWSILGSGLPAVAVYDLGVDEASRELVAGTHGRSTFRIALPEWTAREREWTRSASLAHNYPNPFTASTTIPFTLEQGAHVRLRVVDMLGRTVAALVDGLLSAGSHQITWQPGAPGHPPVPAGTYLFVLESAGMGSPSHVRPAVYAN